jgi:hypothetical protein
LSILAKFSVVISNMLSLNSVRSRSTTDRTASPNTAVTGGLSRCPPDLEAHILRQHHVQNGARQLRADHGLVQVT